MLTACATTPQAIVQTGDYFQPNNNPTSKNKAQLYIYRTHDQYSNIPQVMLYANNKPITVLIDSSYNRINLPAGNYQFVASPLGYKTTLTLQENKTYYLELSTQTQLNQQYSTSSFGYSNMNAAPQIIAHYFGLVPETRAIDKMAFCKEITKVTYPNQTNGQTLKAPASPRHANFSIGISVM